MGTPVYAAAGGHCGLGEGGRACGALSSPSIMPMVSPLSTAALRTPAVHEGDEVAAREQIGAVGQIPCELSLEDHLHFAVQKDGKWVDPLSSLGLA